MLTDKVTHLECKVQILWGGEEEEARDGGRKEHTQASFRNSCRVFCSTASTNNS